MEMILDRDHQELNQNIGPCDSLPAWAAHNESGGAFSRLANGQPGRRRLYTRHHWIMTHNHTKQAEPKVWRRCVAILLQSMPPRAEHKCPALRNIPRANRYPWRR